MRRAVAHEEVGEGGMAYVKALEWRPWDGDDVGSARLVLQQGTLAKILASIDLAHLSRSPGCAKLGVPSLLFI